MPSYQLDNENGISVYYAKSIILDERWEPNTSYLDKTDWQSISRVRVDGIAIFRKAEGTDTWSENHT